MSVGMYSRSYGSGDEGKKRPAGQEAPPVRREKQKKGDDILFILIALLFISS